MADAKQSVHSTARDAFLYLLMTVTLYISVISFLMLIFSYIDFLLPDSLNFYRNAAVSTVVGASSSLIVAFPLYFWIASIIRKELVADPERQEMGIRKWLIYLTLFVAAVVMIGFLIGLISSFYSGSLTLSFALKVLSILIVAGLVFKYHLWEIKEVVAKSELPKQMAWLASVMVAAALIGGVFVVGSPATRRAERFDEQRVSDLQSMQWQLVTYWQRKEALPAKLEDLNDAIASYTVPTDPETKVSYEYKQTGTLSFDLCATFGRAGSDMGSNAMYYPKPVPLSMGESSRASTEPLAGTWAHDAGRVCFNRTIDPELYPPDSKTE